MNRIRQLLRLIIVMVVISESAATSAEPRWPEALKEAQIKALISGDVADLKPFSGQGELLWIT